VDEGG